MEHTTEGFWFQLKTLLLTPFHYMEKAPGCFVFVGSANPATDSEWVHHHGRFNVDEATLKTGAELYLQYAYNYLKNN